MVSRGSLAMLLAFVMATLDASSMSILKNLTLNGMSKVWFGVATVLYALHPWLFLKGLSFSSMTVMNLSVDLISDVLVTALGLFYFREQLSPARIVGVLLAFASLFLLGHDSLSKT